MFLAVYLLVSISLVSSGPVPVRPDDLIMGTDFLSIIIRQQSNSKSFKVSTSTEKFIENLGTRNSAKPLETITTSEKYIETTTSISEEDSEIKLENEEILIPAASIDSRISIEEPTFGARITQRRSYLSSKLLNPLSRQLINPKTRYNAKNYEVKNERLIDAVDKELSVEINVSSTTPKDIDNEKTNEVHVEKGLEIFDKTLSAETTEASQKFGYVVEERNVRKYRLEERTPDGFIVGEYGVVSHDDGQHRGVRYTADPTINPKLIYEALMKFLKL